MWPNKVEEKDKHADKIVGGLERRKTLFSFVPCLKLLVKTFNQVIGNIIFEALYLNMCRAY